MRGHLFFAAIAASIACAVPAGANTALDIDAVVGDGGGGVGGNGGGGLGGRASSVLPPYLQCVPYARRVSGIGIYGDAHTWWGQAAGHYQRGASPRVGAVMAFAPHGKMLLGHVAAVSKIVDSRTVLLRHANWSLIGGRRGQIEDNVRAIDVSAAGDWSEVRVWFAPIGGLGSTHWPVTGFIYPAGTKAPSSSVSFAAQSLERERSDPIGEIIAASARR